MIISIREYANSRNPPYKISKCPTCGKMGVKGTLGVLDSYYHKIEKWALGYGILESCSVPAPNAKRLAEVALFQIEKEGKSEVRGYVYKKRHVDYLTKLTQP